MLAALKSAAAGSGKLVRVFLAFLIAASLIPITALIAPQKAYAASSPPATLTGRFTLAPSFSCSPSYQGDFPGTITLNGGYTVYSFGDDSTGTNGRAHCISPGAANWGDPSNLNNRGGTVNATWYSNDPAAGISWYRITIIPDIQPAVGAAGIQYLGNTWLAVPWDFEGWIKLVKSSSIPSISNDNSDYSLAGAVYEVHRSSDNALVTTLTTSAQGEATSAGLEPGNYYLVEKTAPKGFNVDVTTHNVTVVSSETAIVAVKDEPLGWLELIKTSANTDITFSNDCYSLQDAVYGVYASAADANADKNRITALTTDVNGHSKSPEMVPLGTYYVKEVIAPKGYATDSTVYRIEHNKALTRLDVVDRPKSDPTDIFVKKIDADTAENLSQGAALLSDAEFTIRYYDGYYNSVTDAEASGHPTRVWAVVTDEDGVAKLRESYLKAGSDPLYHNSFGDAAIPLGTVLIQETKAPLGYVLPSPAPISVQQITSNNNLETVTTYNEPIVPDSVKRGDIALIKAFDPTPENDTGIMVPEECITFDFYGSHQFVGTKINDGETPAFSITTDTEGYADTSSIYVIANTDGTYTQRFRTTDDGGGIPFDTYLLVQRSAPAGFEPIQPLLVAVAEDGTTYSYLLQNGTIQTPLKIIKVDSETGQQVPYPASWRIIDTLTGKPIAMTTHYPTEQTFDVFTSDNEGRLTLPELLPWGSFELREISAPASGGIGYIINPVNVVFTTEAGHDWDNPLEVFFADAPAKGRIEIIKSDSISGNVIEGTTYVIKAVGNIYTLDGTLRAKDGDIVDTITTDENGLALSKDLYLGHYQVVEAISPQGFALDTTYRDVVLEYLDQTVAIVTETLELTDAPTTLKLKKVDALTGEPLANVSFIVVNETTTEELVITTGKNGEAVVGYLIHGTYTVTEIAAPIGYVSSDEVHRFTVDDQGLIEGFDTLILVIENTPIQVSISKTDIATSEELSGCELEIYQTDSDGNPTGDALYSWTSSDVPYVITGGLEPGCYILHELYPAPGYVTAKDIAFEVIDTQEIQKVVMEDDFTKLEVVKLDSTTTNQLIGAKFVIYAADENDKSTGAPLYEWVSGDSAFKIERIPVGDYILHEAVAPSGYALAQDVPFTIIDTGDVQKVVIYDGPLPKSPDTPGKGYDKTGQDFTLLYVLGASLVLGGLTGIYFGIKKLRRIKPQEIDEETLPANNSED
jgi:uncharacterized surface anchored protein